MRASCGHIVYILVRKKRQDQDGLFLVIPMWEKKQAVKTELAPQIRQMLIADSQFQAESAKLRYFLSYFAH